MSWVSMSFLKLSKQDGDGRDEPGHDDERMYPTFSLELFAYD